MFWRECPRSPLPPVGGSLRAHVRYFGGKPNGHMRMLTGASRRLAKRHSATVRSPAPSHTKQLAVMVEIVSELNPLSPILLHDAVGTDIK